MPTTSTSSTSSSVAATNPALNQLFTSLFGGSTGLGTSSAGTLGNVMSGNQMKQNTSQLYTTLYGATQPAYQQQMAQIREQAGKAGLSASTSLTGQEMGYSNQYLGNLTQLATQMGLQETSLQGGIAGNLMAMLSQAGNQYFTDKSTTQAMTMDWSKAFSTTMAGLTDLSAAGGITGLGSSLWS